MKKIIGWIILISVFVLIVCAVYLDDGVRGVVSIIAGMLLAVVVDKVMGWVST